MSKTIKKQSFDELAGYNEAYDYADDYAIDYSEDEDVISLDGLPLEEGIVAQVFSESDFSEEDELEKDMTLQQALDSMVEGEGNLEEMAEELEELHEEAEEVRKLIPGSSISSEDLDDSEEDVETDFENDGDLTKFVSYLRDQYPANIPSHDGTSISGCERAISFLDGLNSVISKAVREDSDSVINIVDLDEIRSSIFADILTLKDHLGKLKKKLKENHSKAASTPPLWEGRDGNKVDLSLTKEAGTPNNVVIAVSPFERAISGMMINAHISAGLPMDKVFDELKEKYDLSEREELSIMQICMDSGFPMFKDRGGSSGDDASGSRIDFMKNYFA